MKHSRIIYSILLLFIVQLSFAQSARWKKGILVDEFIFDTASFPQAHASTIAETDDGLVAAWFGGTREGYKDVCIWTSRQVNNKWTKPEMVADGKINDSTRYACYNPVLFYTPEKELLLFYKIGPYVAGWTGWMMRSKDNGHTWSKRESLPNGYLGPIKNKPVMENGTLVCPSSTENEGWRVHFEYTKDWGRTWTKSAPINDGKKIMAIQPSILHYKNGDLQVIGRTRNEIMYQSWSKDGGKSWSEMSSLGLPNNNSGTDAVSLSNGYQLVVYNHVLPDSDWINAKGPRTPLNVSLSKDGKKWYAALVLEDSPISQYSYPSVIQGRDGMVYIVYTWRRKKIKFVKIDPSKLKLSLIKNERWSGKVNPIKGKVTDD